MIGADTMGKVIRLDKPMTKAEVIRHLETDHSQAVTVKLDPARWTKQNLVETHRIIHLGLGR